MCPATKVVSIHPSQFLKQRYIITLHLTVRKRTHYTYHKKTERDLNKIHPTATCNGVSAVSSMSTNNAVLFPHPTRCTSEFKRTVMKPHTLCYDVTLRDSKPLYCVYFLITFQVKLIRFTSISKHLVTSSLPPLAASHVVHACQCGTPHILCEFEINKQEVTYEY